MTEINLKQMKSALEQIKGYKKLAIIGGIFWAYSRQGSRALFHSVRIVPPHFAKSKP